MRRLLRRWLLLLKWAVMCLIIISSLWWPKFWGNSFLRCTRLQWLSLYIGRRVHRQKERISIRALWHNNSTLSTLSKCMVEALTRCKSKCFHTNTISNLCMSVRSSSTRDRYILYILIHLSIIHPSTHPFIPPFLHACKRVIVSMHTPTRPPTHPPSTRSPGTSTQTRCSYMHTHTLFCSFHNTTTNKSKPNSYGNYNTRGKTAPSMQEGGHAQAQTDPHQSLPPAPPNSDTDLGEAVRLKIRVLTPVVNPCGQGLRAGVCVPAAVRACMVEWWW